MTEVILSTRAVEKSFGRTQALRGVSLDLTRGEVLAVTGPSGGGKSTLLHCLSGILRPEAGEVRYGGQRLDDLAEAPRTRLRRREFGIDRGRCPLMTRLAWTFLRSAGWSRAALLAATTAVATALVLVALTMLLLPSQPAEALFSLVAEPGLRWGTAFATAMLVLPLLLMLNHVVRLGTATRERRLAAMRLAGATPAEVRRIGAVEVGFPVTAGAVAGPLVFALLRELFGGQGVHPGFGGGSGYFGPTSTLALIPTSVTPAWWQIAAVVAAVAAAGVATGALASRHLVASPLGVSRRVRRPAPRPWGLLLVGTGLGAMAVAVSGAFGRGQAVVMAGILLVVLGIIALAPWVAFRSGQRAARRTSDPATLIAAGHLVSDPRPAGRAAAAVGAIGIGSGVAAVMEVGIFFYSSFIDQFFVISFALVGVALILVLLVTASTLAVHAAESLVDRRRVLAALVAAGTPVSVLRTRCGGRRCSPQCPCPSVAC